MRDNARPLEPGERDPNFDTNFLTVVVVAMACFIAVGFALFPRHDPSSAIGPSATATLSTGGGGPSAPSPVAPASPPGGPPERLAMAEKRAEATIEALRLVRPAEKEHLMPIYGTAGDVDARPAHLFRCGDLYAVTLDPTGSNIPRDGCYGDWKHVSDFELGVHEVVPAAMNPEPIIRGIRAYGYYVWSITSRAPTGTTQ